MPSAVRPKATVTADSVAVTAAQQAARDRFTERLYLPEDVLVRVLTRASFNQKLYEGPAHVRS